MPEHPSVPAYRCWFLGAYARARAREPPYSCIEKKARVGYCRREGKQVHTEFQEAYARARGNAYSCIVKGTTDLSADLCTREERRFMGGEHEA